MKPENIMRLPRILIKKRQGLGIYGGSLKQDLITSSLIFQKQGVWGRKVKMCSKFHSVNYTIGTDI